MKGSQLKAHDPVRGLIVGYPGGGKTGSVASLLNVGYKVRVLNFENLNYRSLIEYTDTRALDNLDILSFEDASHMGQKFMEPLGAPHAFNDALNAMKEWKGKDDKGKEYSLGKSREWGLDTVVVLDSMTSQGEAAHRRAANLLNRTPGNFQIQDWGFVVNDQLEALRLLGAKSNRYHLLVLGHLRLISPEDYKKGDEELTRKIKEEVGSLLSSKLFPVAATKNLSTQIAKEFPMVIQAKQETQNGKEKRWLYTSVGEGLDLKMPAKAKETRYPLETGLASIFEALGHKAPGFKK